MQISPAHTVAFGLQMKPRKLKQLLVSHGWQEAPHVGSSHIKFTHPKRTDCVLLAVHKGKDVPFRILNSILQQTGLYRIVESQGKAKKRGSRARQNPSRNHQSPSAV